MSNSQTSPTFKHLDNPSHIVELRRAVKPILSNRLLTNFTDHSVKHSDSVSELVDELLEPLQASQHKLNEQELTILYSACYLHDIGLHYEKAGDTKIINSLGLSSSWEGLSENERRRLLREYHHNISAEMIMNSVRAENPIIGLQMTDRYSPELVASISEAHNMSVESERYRELTNDFGNIRMELLSGILRIADILDESRRRATLEQARTLELDLTSQTHWWRHYYTKDIKIDQNDHLITVWFDFPPNRHNEYKNVVPELQMPWIEREFENHRKVFSKYDFSWSVTHTVRASAYSSSAKMPDLVFSEMLKQLSASRKKESENLKNKTLQHFRQTTPYFERRITELKENKEEFSKGKYLQEVSEISEGLWGVGGKRSAINLLRSAFHDGLKELSSKDQITISIQLAKMRFEDNQARFAIQDLQNQKENIESLSDNHELKFKFWHLLAQILSNLCGYDDAIEAFEKAIKFSPSDIEKHEIEAEIAELHFLHGNLESIL